MESFDLQVKEIKDREKEKELYSLSCDILRALVILYGSAWHDELLTTLSELWSLGGFSLEDRIEREKNLEEALKFLNSKGIIKSEKRMRGYLEREKASEEPFHTVLKLSSLIRLFSGDALINRYRRASMGY